MWMCLKCFVHVVILCISFLFCIWCSRFCSARSRHVMPGHNPAIQACNALQFDNFTALFCEQSHWLRRRSIEHSMKMVCTNSERNVTTANEHHSHVAHTLKKKTLSAFRAWNKNTHLEREHCCYHPCRIGHCKWMAPSLKYKTWMQWTHAFASKLLCATIFISLMSWISSLVMLLAGNVLVKVCRVLAHRNAARR